MPVFEYSALNIKGKAVAGVIDAESAVAVRQKLRASKVFPVSIKEVSDAAVKKETGTFDFNRLFSRISLSEISPIQTWSLRRITEKRPVIIRRDDGKRLSAALQSSRTVFSRLTLTTMWVFGSPSVIIIWKISKMPWNI